MWNYFYQVQIIKILPVPRLCISFLVLSILLSGCRQKDRANLIIQHARIYTVDSAFHIAEAIAIRDGKILASGTDAEILSRFTADSMMDGGGKVIYPGIIDAHSHFVSYGRSLFEVNLFGCRDWHEAIERVKAFAKEHPDEPWIRGRGWDQNTWPGKSFPENSSLNQLFPNTPLLLQRVDGHAAIANACALSKAGIHPNQGLEGGQIETRNGQLTGLLVDNAVELITNLIKPGEAKDYEKWLLAAQQKCFEQGLTTVSDCGLMGRDVEAIQALQQQQKLLMRMYVMLSDDPENYTRYFAKGPWQTDRLFVNGFKVYADGALGSRGACLLAPYSDKPGWNGFLLRSQSHYDSVAKMLANSKWQMCTHAIGDSGNRMILRIYNHYLVSGNDRRWRIEHAQVVDTSDFKLFKLSNIIPSVQPTHATSDMPWAEDRLGPVRIKGAYAYQQLLQQNGWLPLGTDFPVEDISPLKTFYAAVVRKDIHGNPTKGFQMENALSREQALRGMTIWAARAGFMDQKLGSLEPGKQADFMITDEDLMSVPDSMILKIRIQSTYINGKRVFGH